MAKSPAITDSLCTSRWMWWSTMLWLLFYLLSLAFFLTGLYSDGPPHPHWSASLLSVRNREFYYCLLNAGLTHNKMGCQFYSILHWCMLWTAWCVWWQSRVSVITFLLEFLRTCYSRNSKYYGTIHFQFCFEIFSVDYYWQIRNI